MDTDAVLELVKKSLKPSLDELKAEIVEFTLKRAGPNLVLRLLVDKKGGVTISECAVLNKRIGDIIDECDLISERYLLEVSSPGLDRPLRSKKDFERIQGEVVTMTLLDYINGKNFYRGMVTAAEEKNVVIEDEDLGQIPIPYNMIAKARLKIKP